MKKRSIPIIKMSIIYSREIFIAILFETHQLLISVKELGDF